MKSIRRKALRVILYTFLALIVLTIGAVVALTLPGVQQRITRKAETFLQKKLGTRVEIGGVRVRFPVDIALEHFLLEDQQGDTLARAGNLVVAIGMWKLLNKTIEIQKITLENAAVFLHQKDSIYNFDFAALAFSSPNNSEPIPTEAPPDTTAAAWRLQLDLAELQLQNVHFLLQDDDAQSTTAAKIGRANTVIHKADLKNLYFELNDFSLSDANIQLISKKKSSGGGKPSPSYRFLFKNADIFRTHIVYSTTEMDVEANLEKTELNKFQIHSANDAIAIQSKGIQVENSAVAYRDPEATPTPGHFNAGDLDLTQLQAELPDFSFQNDSIFVRADALSGTDKSGVQVHSLQMTTLVTLKTIQIKHLQAQLNQTYVDGDVLLFKNDKATYDRMDVQLRKAKGIVGDLLILIPPPENETLSRLRSMPYEASGHLTGWLENLQTDNIQFRAGTGTMANFTGSVQQLTDPTKLGMHLKISRLESNRADLVQFMSVGDTPLDSLLAQPLPAHLVVSGDLDGTVSRLQLNMRGEISPLQTGPMSPPNVAPPKNVAEVSNVADVISTDIAQFEVAGILTEVDNPDRLGMDLRINRLDVPGNFVPKNLADLTLPDLTQITGTLRGTLAALHTDVKIKALRSATSSQLAFSGLLQNIRTPKQLGFDVVFDGSLARREIWAYLPDSMANQSFHLPDFVKINGQAKGNMQAAAAKTQIGLGDWGVIRADGTLRDDSIYLVDLVAENLLVNRLLVDSSLQPLKTLGFSAKIKGAGFDFGKTAQVQLAGKIDSVIWENLVLRDLTLNADVQGRRFTADFQSPDARVDVRAKASGDFTSNIPLLETDILLNCLDLRAFGRVERPTIVCMHILSHSEGFSLDTLTAKLTIEKIDLQYDTVHIRPGDLTLDVKLDNHQNDISLASDWLQGEAKGYFSLPDLPETLANIAEQYFAVDRTAIRPPTGTDSLFVTLKLLKTDVLTTGLLPGLTELAPMNLEGTLVARRNYFNFLLQMPRTNYLDWAVDSLNVRAFAGDTAAMFVVTTPLVKRGEQTFAENAVLDGRFLANVGDLSFTARSKDGRDRFMLALQALLNQQTKETRITLSPRQVIDFKEWTVNANNQIRIAPGGVDIRDFELTGDGQSVKVKGATSKNGLDFAVDIERLNFGNFDIFVTKILSELGGWADAHLTIRGTADAPQVRGKMQLHEASFTPVATNVRYELSETPLEFTASGVSLDGFSLRDPFGKTLDIRGKLATSDWKKIESNLTLHADRWQALNSAKQQNPVYFGELYVSLDGTVRGDLTQPDVQIAVKTAKASTFTYIYDVATQTLQHEGIVYFVQPPRPNARPLIYDAPVNMAPFTLSASIEIDSNLTISSVVNPVTGDDFRGKALGKLQFDLLANNNMTLSGQVELVRGVYNYSYQSVVKRNFDVMAGSTILWTGDANRPELNLKARYQFKASPYPLVVNQLSAASAAEAAAYRKPQTFFLETTLNGAATQPDVAFQFIYPASQKDGSIGRSVGGQPTDLVQSAVSTVNEDKNLLSRQVFGVLLLRNFVGENIGASTNISGGNPLKSGLSSFLTSQLNALSDQYLTWIDVDLTTTEGATNNSASTAEGSTNYQLRLQKSFFEDRLTFKLSGGTSVGGANGDEVHSALENASVEYALTSDGKWKMTVFSERGFELLNASSGNLRNSGLGLVLSREFGKR